MAILGEEVIVEWLNRDGYFTIRGIKIGRNEIDILAIKPLPDGGHDCRHIEVHLSAHPMGYITGPGAKRRSEAELKQGVQDWIKKKFIGYKGQVEKVRQSLCSREWTRELVLWNWNAINEPEVEALRRHDIRIWRLEDVVERMVKDMKAQPRDNRFKSAAGGALFDLMMLFVKEEERATSKGRV